MLFFLVLCGGLVVVVVFDLVWVFGGVFFFLEWCVGF